LLALTTEAQRHREDLSTLLAIQKFILYFFLFLLCVSMVQKNYIYLISLLSPLPLIIL